MCSNVTLISRPTLGSTDQEIIVVGSLRGFLIINRWLLG